jgi:hypothetical protein
MRTSFVRYVSPTPRHTSFRKERAIVGAARGRSASAIPDRELIHPGVSDLNRETPFGNSTRILSIVVAHLHCAGSAQGDREHDTVTLMGPALARRSEPASSTAAAPPPVGSLPVSDVRREVARIE